MAEFKLFGGNPPATTPAGVMTQGIGFPLREVDLDTVTGAINANEVTVNIPGYPQITNVAEFLAALAVLSGQISVGFGRNATTPVDDYLRYAGVIAGKWICPANALITSIGISRDDTDTANIEVLVNGVVEASVVSNTTTSLHGLTVPINQGDALQIRNAASGNTVSNLTASLIIRSVL